jgi:hypothetical protein
MEGELGLLVLPVLVGEGEPLALGADSAGPLALRGSREWPGGAVELLYGEG